MFSFLLLLLSYPSVSMVLTTELHRPTLSRNYVSRRVFLDVSKISSLIAVSNVGARALIRWEDYDCANLKPSRFHQVGSTYGLASNFSDRQRRFAVDNDSNTVDILSYNEVMADYRIDTVAGWEKLKKTSPTRFLIAHHIESLQNAKRSLVDCLKLSEDYNFEEVRKTVYSPVVGSLVSDACDFFVIKGGDLGLSREERSTIGFNWGSCAWRSNACGAQADAQEAIGEVKKYVGLLEPFEVNFCLGIAIRSLDEVLDIVEGRDFKILDDD